MNGHGSNIKVVDPVLRKLRYETVRSSSSSRTWSGTEVEGLMENPPEETPGLALE